MLTEERREGAEEITDKFSTELPPLRSSNFACRREKGILSFSGSHCQAIHNHLWPYFSHHGITIAELKSTPSSSIRSPTTLVKKKGVFLLLQKAQTLLLVTQFITYSKWLKLLLYSLSLEVSSPISDLSQAWGCTSLSCEIHLTEYCWLLV